MSDPHTNPVDPGRSPSLDELQRDADDLSGTILKIHSEIREALGGIRQMREAIESFSAQRLRDTQARLDEVSSTTENAALEILNGLDRTLAMVDELQVGIGPDRRPPGEVCDALRAEVNHLYGCLQFQDIVAQQIAGAGALLGDVETRLVAVAVLLDGSRAWKGPSNRPAPPAERGSGAYNANASVRDVAGRQALIDQAFGTARNGAGAGAPRQPG